MMKIPPPTSPAVTTTPIAAPTCFEIVFFSGAS